MKETNSSPSSRILESQAFPGSYTVADPRLTVASRSGLNGPRGYARCVVGRGIGIGDGAGVGGTEGSGVGRSVTVGSGVGEGVGANVHAHSRDMSASSAAS